jgi:hypothetical protein
MKLVFADHVAHGAVGDEQLAGQHAPAAVGRRQQILGDDPLQRIGQLHDDLPLRVAFEHADDPLQRVRDVGRVHGGQHEVARFRRRQRRGHGLMIAHFAHHDHVRVLPQHVDQGAIEGAHVGQHFLLHDDGPFVLMHKFDRVFDGDDLAAALAVDEIDQDN